MNAQTGRAKKGCSLNFEPLEFRHLLTSISFVQNVVEPSFATGRFETTDVADIDLDGDLDLISIGVLNRTIAWYENVNGRFGPKKLIDIAEPIRGERFTFARVGTAGDLDGDGDADVVVSLGRQLVWYENLDGKGAFAAQKVVAQLELSDRGIRDVSDIGILNVLDLDGDNRLDIVAVTSRIHVLNQEADFSFSVRTIEDVNVGNTAFTRPFKAADLDGDGDIDFFSRDRDSLALVMQTERGFERQLVEFPGTQVVSVYAGDIDGDGDMDGIVAYAIDPRRVQISWIENLTAGRTNVHAVGVTGSSPGHYYMSAHAADIDNDGDLDVVAGSEWYENVGDGTLFEERSTSGNSGHSADIDLDGDVDLVSFRSGDLMQWLENDSKGNFTAHTVASHAIGVRSLGSGDLDGDGDEDVLGVFETLDSNVLFWYENLEGRAFGGQVRLHSVRDWPDERYFVPKVANAVDIDGDGDVDIAVAGYLGAAVGSEGDEGFYGIVLFENSSRADGFTPRLIANWGSGGDRGQSSPTGIISGDFDGDEETDLVVSVEDRSVFLVRQNGEAFSEPELQGNVNLRESSRTPYLQSVSIEGNRDGLVIFDRPDLVAGSLWGLSSASSEFEQVSLIRVDGDGSQLNQVADFDGDGGFDAVRFELGELVFFRNEGGSFFEELVIIPYEENQYCTWFHITDIDQDGDPDVVVSCSGSVSISWYENRLVGDANNDNEVDFADFLLLSDNFGKDADAVWADGDFDLDGEIDFADYLALSASFGNAR